MDLSNVANIQGLKSLKSLRAIRALRPLRVVSRNEELKILVIAFFRMIPVILSLVYVSGIMMWVISIVMVIHWKGTFYYCASLGLPDYDMIENREVEIKSLFVVP